MTRFPHGGWDIDDLDDLGAWANSLKVLEPNKTLRGIVVKLKDLSTRLETISAPDEFDEASSIEQGPAMPSCSSAPSEAPVFVTDKRGMKVATVDQDPKVSLLLLSCKRVLIFCSVIDASKIKRDASIPRTKANRLVASTVSTSTLLVRFT